MKSISRIFTKQIPALRRKGREDEISLSDVVLDGYSDCKKTALLIYVDAAIRQHVKGQYREEDFYFHSMYWESIEMVRKLNEAGYKVDVRDCFHEHADIAWSKYELVVDERNNFFNAPETEGQKRIHYATGCHWLTHNLGELQRISDFRSRHSIIVPPVRQIKPNLEEATADIVSFFGGDFQKNSFTHPEKTFRLPQTMTFAAPSISKDVKRARRNFLWIGSSGLVHKGLDIVVEAFAVLPQFTLHICTRLESEPAFHKWFTENFSGRKNIQYHGWMNVRDRQFQDVAKDCIATVSCSVSEGGAGATLQAMEFGCIPIVNDVVYDAVGLKEGLGFKLAGRSSQQLISSLQDQLAAFDRIDDAELISQSRLSSEHVKRNNSRALYSERFGLLINAASNA